MPLPCKALPIFFRAPQGARGQNSAPFPTSEFSNMLELTASLPSDYGLRLPSSSSTYSDHKGYLLQPAPSKRVSDEERRVRQISCWSSPCPPTEELSKDSFATCKYWPTPSECLFDPNLSSTATVLHRFCISLLALLQAPPSNYTVWLHARHESRASEL